MQSGGGLHLKISTHISFLKILNIFTLCELVLCLHVYNYTTYMQCLWNSEEGVGSSWHWSYGGL